MTRALINFIVGGITQVANLVIPPHWSTPFGKGTGRSTRHIIYTIIPSSLDDHQDPVNLPQIPGETWRRFTSNRAVEQNPVGVGGDRSVGLLQGVDPAER